MYPVERTYECLRITCAREPPQRPEVVLLVRGRDQDPLLSESGELCVHPETCHPAVPVHERVDLAHYKHGHDSSGKPRRRCADPLETLAKRALNEARVDEGSVSGLVWNCLELPRRDLWA